MTVRALLVVALTACLGTATACRRSQPGVCRQLIACAEALIPTVGQDLHTAYGPGANCWKSRESAASCTQSCTDALEGLKTHPNFAATLACQPK